LGKLTLLLGGVGGKVGIWGNFGPVFAGFTPGGKVGNLG
jgi:hypothetical protein